MYVETEKQKFPPQLISRLHEPKKITGSDKKSVPSFMFVCNRLYVLNRAVSEVSGPTSPFPHLVLMEKQSLYASGTRLCHTF